MYIIYMYIRVLYACLHILLSLHAYRKDAHTDAQYVQEGLQIEQASILYNICEQCVCCLNTF